MTAEDAYDRIWDLLVATHRRMHGDHTPPKGDLNCCPEYGVMMALRAASTIKPGYPGYLLERAAILEDLDREFFVENVLATDGEAEPTNEDALREYRAARRHHILWNELKGAAARIEELERREERAGSG